MNILKYNKFNFINENIPCDIIKESSEFGNMQMGQLSNPLGPGYGFTQDPSLSIYSDDSSPYVDNYQRMSRVVQDLSRVMKNLYGTNSTSISAHKLDYFLEDIEEFQNFKILRIIQNNKLLLDVYISFVFMEEEFFGVYRNYNDLNKPTLDTDLFSDPRFSYINKEYKLKLSNYFYKILYNWFIPSIGDYKIITDELKVKNSLGDNIILKKNATIYVKGYNTDQNNKPFLIIKHNDNIYKLLNNDFFFFKYWCKNI